MVTDSRDNDAIREVEEMIRAAGRFVQSTDDLRPRILEAARSQYRERLVRSWMQHAAVLVVLLGTLTVSLNRDDGSYSERSRGLTSVRTAVAQVESASQGDSTWQMVESYTKLKQQQAQLLRFDL